MRVVWGSTSGAALLGALCAIKPCRTRSLAHCCRTPPSVDRHPSDATHKTLAIAFHKPKGVVTSRVDPLGRPTVYDALLDALPTELRRHDYQAVGRLDLNTSGLLLFTNDGWLAHQVTNPTARADHRVLKTYRARVAKLTDAALQQLRQGVELGGGLGRSQPAAVEVDREERSSSWVRLTLCEGKNRQVRRMLHAVGSGVIELERIAVGGLTLDRDLCTVGSWRLLQDDEVREHLGYEPRRLPADSTSRKPRSPRPEPPPEPVQSASAGVRVNKALRASHSRREADRLVATGRVKVNGKTATAGQRLESGDDVRLDGEQVDWERLNFDDDAVAVDGVSARDRFVYLKLWKRRGVECTSDKRVRRNIIDALGPLPNVRDRVFPVGRLDVDSTGLILLTSDGTIVNRLLRKAEGKSKEYLVTTNERATEAQIERLRSGVVITTVAQRDGVSRPLTAPTRPCIVERASGKRQLRFVLEEGRNRQIRRMCEALGLRVDSLHRVGFAGLGLEGCAAPGEWRFLTPSELDILGVE